MDGMCWLRVYRYVCDAARSLPRTPRVQHSDARIVLTFLWAVVQQRPISWACRSRHWPPHLRHHALPSPATMSRRLRRREVLQLLATMLVLIQQTIPCGSMAIIDGKPLPIGGYSKDPDAGYGRGAGVMARGYKLHLICSITGRVIDWDVAALNVSEQRVARTLLPAAEHDAGFVLGDANYDANALYELAGNHGMQLLTPRRYRKARGIGHHKHSLFRLRAIRMLSDGLKPLLYQRLAIERFFAHLSNSLCPLPNWVRRQHRVENWVHAKLILNAIRITGKLEGR